MASKGCSHAGASYWAPAYPRVSARLNAAANATIGGHFIPLLTLGIPGSGATAVILGAFLVKGIQPGPNIFTTSSELVYAIFATQYLALVIMLAVTYLSVGLYVKILRIPEAVIASMIIVFTLLDPIRCAATCRMFGS